MKMGIIASPWRYDAVTRYAFQSAKSATDCDFLLRFAGLAELVPERSAPATDFPTWRAHSTNRSTNGLRVRFLKVRTMMGHGSLGKSTGNSFSLSP